MRSGRRSRQAVLRRSGALRLWIALLGVVLVIRLSKGALLSDAYALLSTPFWPGTAQSEWLRAAQQLDQQGRVASLERDNQRLRQLLDLQRQQPRDLQAPVISREPAGWWQQLTLGRGSLRGVAVGDAVLAPGGLVGLVSAVTPATARVTLLTDPTSRVGVWVGRNQRHALLIGAGTSRPLLRFIEKDPGVRPGDVVTTSPASTLVPPNLTVGVIQTVDEQTVPAPEAVLQLSAPLDAIDWVQVRPRRLAP
jgi:rod shape-determining protein MreC